VIAALLLLAQITPLPPEPKPVGTTIAAIHNDPKRFDGQVVRLHGYVNSCQPAVCLISERPANAPGGAGESLSMAANAKFDQVVRPLIPTYVELDARVDASCLVAACVNQTPVLTIVTLRGVVSPEPPAFENN
jgi:hypothetical protein